MVPHRSTMEDSADVRTSQVTDMDLMFEYEGEAISRTRNEDDTDSETDDEDDRGQRGRSGTMYGRRQTVVCGVHV